MKRLIKSAEVIGRVLGVVMGNNFTTPIAHTLEKYPYLWFSG